MPVATQAHREFEAGLFERLQVSERFLIYQNAFRTATGLPLRLVSADPEQWCLDDQSVNRSPFCEMLNLCKRACDACVETNRKLIKEAEASGPSTCHCFAGLSATAVPVKMGAAVVAYLKTGQVFHQMPDEARFNEVVGAIGRKTLDGPMLKQLRTAYFETQTIDPQRYNSMVKLLHSFAEQLGAQAESLAIINEGSEPAAIAKARQYILANLDQPLPLGDVARHAGLSASHFCRMFKDFTGLTLTDYINRSRVEWAKRELLKPEVRISEIAFLVGYQSLSQFNRSFSRIVGASPTDYRRERLYRTAS
ncbi:MAG: helix-turn-helix domain-containing protein [Verrucomicrobiales bacterium]